MAEHALTSVLCHLRCLAESSDDRRQSDRQLLERFQQQHDESAFAVLMRRHGRLVLSAIRRVLHEEADVEDAFQATFLVLLRKASSVRWQSSLGSWLFGVAHRIALKARANALRRQRHESEASRARRAAAEDSDGLSWREALELLHEELDRLPDKYRLPLLLCYLDGKTREEAAGELGCTVNAIKWQLERGRDLLRSRLIRRGVTLSSALLAALVDAPAGQSVAPALIQATLNAARTGIYRSSVAVLMRAATPALWMGKARLTTGVLLMVSLLAVGGGSALSPPSAAPEPPTSRPSERRQAPTVPAHAKAKDSIVVRGRVLGPDGKPLKGARLYSVQVPNIWPHNDAVAALAQPNPTGADGRFRITTMQPGHDKLAYLIAYSAGSGVDWINLGEADLAPEVTLRLVKDVPITGRVVNTEGRPVAGASVSIAQVWASDNAKLDEYLASWLRNFRDNPAAAALQKRLVVPLDGITGKATTDKDGRFTLRGAGSERIVHVAFAGAGVARTTPWIITRPRFDTKPYNAVLREKQNEYLLTANRFPGLFSPSFTFVAEAGKTIVGAVKDAATGKPLAGCRIYTQTSYVHGLAVVSDAEGKYRLDGLAKRARGHYVAVGPPKGTAYLGRTMDVADTVGFAAIRLDIELAKGAIVTGRVVDRQTGKPVHCYVRSVPLPGNKFFGSKPGFDRQDADEAMEVGDDGRFRLATIPGKALLTARVLESEKLHGLSGLPLYVYRRAVPDPDHKDIFQWSGDSWSYRTAAGITDFLDIENAVKVVDVKEKGENRVEMVVDRGKTIRIAVQDADGKPLAGAWVAGLTDTNMYAVKLSEATATVYALNPDKLPRMPFFPALVSALNPDKPRRLAFFHAEKKLGGMATVRGDEKGPVIVKLVPVGKVTGHLLDSDGNPLEGVEVSIFADTKIGHELYHSAAPTGQPVRTDKGGLFCIEGVVPDLKFRLNLRKGRTFFIGQPRIGVKQIGPSKTLDLGNVRIKPAR